MTRPAISAVIPTYNRGPLIARALDSVLGQTYPPSEIIIVDDGSRDDTRTRVASYGDAVRYIHQENSGASVARNRGVDEARSAWIAFLDSDDLWLNTHLERMADAIAATEGRAPVYFDDMEQTPEDGGGSLWDHIGFRISGDHEMTEDAASWAMMDRQPMMLQCSVVSRSAYRACGGLRQRFWLTHDTHFFLRIGLGSPACAVAGYGTVQTSADAEHGTRLTQSHGNRTRGYWLETAQVWEDLLAFAQVHAPRWLPRLRLRYANAYWRLAKHDLREGHRLLAISGAARAVAIDPLFPVGLAYRVARDRYLRAGRTRAGGGASA